MKLSETLPKTSQPPIGDFVKKYRELVQDGSEVLSIHLSSALSGTVQTAQYCRRTMRGQNNSY